MTKADFLNQYIIRHRLIDDNEGNIVLTTSISLRDTNTQIGRLQAVLNILETQDLIELIKFNNAQNLNWDYLIDMNKRIHLDHYYKKFNVTDFFPLDTNNKIEDLYN